MSTVPSGQDALGLRKGPAILLFRGRGVVSALIRWQTRSCYSHAALLLPDGRILEAWQGAGVRVKPLTNWEGVDAFRIKDATDANWDQIFSFALLQLGCGYDWWAILRFVSRRLMPSNYRWFCSELVFAACASAGLRLLSRIDSSAVSPALLSLSPRLVRLDSAHELPPVFAAPKVYRCSPLIEL